MIDDLKAYHPIYKFVDDSTPFEIVNKNTVSTIQESIDQISEWTCKNDMRLNAQKTHEMTISFAKNPVSRLLVKKRRIVRRDQELKCYAV